MTLTKKSPYLFDEFFSSGKEESVSPFLTKKAKRWSHNLSLKVSCLSALCLITAYIFYFFSLPISHVCLLCVYFLSGTPALIHAIEDCKNLEINIDVLMTLAALLSVVIGSGFEGALLLVLFELSASMEISVLQKTKSTLAHLHRLSPTTAYVVTENHELLERSIQEIPIGSKIFIKAGEVVPLDGTVLEGSSFITLSHLTGESTPIAKSFGDEVLAGSHNLDGALTLLTTHSSQESTLSKIIHLITQAQETKPKLQKWIDAFDKKYATSIIILTFFFGAALPFFFSHLPYLGIEGSIYRALAFLIAASPCALVIGAPTAYLCSISASAKRGILLKGGSILDALAQCKLVAFDKTGTLTTGNLRCLSVELLTKPAHSFPIDAAISLASSMEKHVTHPIAGAIVALAKEKNISAAPVEQLQAVPGSGITGFSTEHGVSCFIGSLSFILEKNPDLSITTSSVDSTTQTYLLIGSALFVFHLQDEIRQEAKKALADLRSLSMQTYMLTGDEKSNAMRVAEQLQMDDVFAQLKPQDKLNLVGSLSQKGGLIMMGDGVNDAPALARATVGISMGKIGSSSAIAASDIVFLQDDLSALDWIVKKSHQTLHIIRQNLILALSVIVFATTPALLGWIPLWLAVILHEGGTLIVGLNSLRLLKQK